MRPNSLEGQSGARKLWMAVCFALKRRAYPVQIPSAALYWIGSLYLGFVSPLSGWFFSRLFGFCEGFSGCPLR
jgi:hypothetical protein